MTIEVPTISVSEIDEFLLERGDGRWAVLEDVILKKAWIVGNFETRREADEEFERLRETMPLEVLGKERVREIPETEWRDSYKAHFHAWQFGPLHWVPIWEKETFKLPPGDQVLWLDPGLAFGTGNHETTRLCVERLVQFAESHGVGGRVIDAGCGSGILALSALKLGFKWVEGFDNDSEAVRVSLENTGLNDLSGKVTFLEADLERGLRGKSARVVLANILANVLCEFAELLVRAVEPGGILILSGILAQEARHVVSVFSAITQGWPVETRAMGEWADVTLHRPS